MSERSKFVFSLGDLIGDRYEVMRTIGEPDATQVYRVRDRSLDDNQVALKLLVESGPKRAELIERLKNEVLVLRRIGHPNIIRVYDYGSLVREGVYITMEFLNGKSLCDFAEDFPSFRVSLKDAVRILKDVACGLEVTHALGIIHRDLKPEHVFVLPEGITKIIDFGAAKSVKSDKRITRRGVVLGTPGYIAPEVLAGKEFDFRADMFSFGLIAYELLTGVVPGYSNADFSTMLTDSLAEFKRLNNTPVWLRDLIETCVEESPSDRFKSMSEVREILERHPVK